MTGKEEDHFWPSYVDLLTSIFFVMLILFVVSYFLLIKEKQVAEEKLEFIEEVEKTLEGLSRDSTIFRFEEEYKRYKLVQEIEFYESKFKIDPYSVKDYQNTSDQLIYTGQYLKSLLDTLQRKRNTDARYKDISYLMIITGMASRDGNRESNYQLSYRRAYALYDFWSKEILDFDLAYRDFIDLQVSGVGEGGIGRNKDDVKNRSFFIQIIPKINSPDL